MRNTNEIYLQGFQYGLLKKEYPLFEDVRDMFPKLSVEGMDIFLDGVSGAIRGDYCRAYQSAMIELNITKEALRIELTYEVLKEIER